MSVRVGIKFSVVVYSDVSVKAVRVVRTGGWSAGGAEVERLECSGGVVVTSWFVDRFLCIVFVCWMMNFDLAPRFNSIPSYRLL